MLKTSGWRRLTTFSKELSDEAEHYRQVAKKYKRTHSIVHRSAVGLGSLSVGLSSGALATAPDRVRYHGQPCTCWRCYALRVVLCWLYLCKQEVGEESDQARKDLHSGPALSIIFEIWSNLRQLKTLGFLNVERPISLLHFNFHKTVITNVS